ncbi:MAG: hypothetical protein CL693_16870 [Cellvibrionaceae bacterium]|nr:hypothetical protein [Cellvibrionaceae bacterium]
MVKSGFSFNPSPKQAYAGAFILNINQNCPNESQCQEEPQVSNLLSVADKEKLEQIKPRTLANCSPATLEKIWSEVSASKDHKLIACAKSTNHRETAIEFLLYPAEKFERMVLSKIY